MNPVVLRRLFLCTLCLLAACDQPPPPEPLRPVLTSVLGATADYWREQRIPFWAFVGGVSKGLRDLPQQDKRGRRAR